MQSAFYIHSVIQFFLTPTLILLGFLFVLCLVELISFTIEGVRRKNIPRLLSTYIKGPDRESLLQSECWKAASKRQKELFTTLLCDRNQTGDLIVRREELKLQRILERTDYASKLGPFLGLMGTLIPLGPGLAALGEGNVEALASAISLAFDTTVLGLMVGGLGFLISRTRRRWYEEYILLLETLNAESRD